MQSFSSFEILTINDEESPPTTSKGKISPKHDANEILSFPIFRENFANSPFKKSAKSFEKNQMEIISSHKFVDVRLNIFDISQFVDLILEYTLNNRRSFNIDLYVDSILGNALKNRKAFNVSNYVDSIIETALSNQMAFNVSLYVDSILKSGIHCSKFFNVPQYIDSILKRTIRERKQFNIHQYVDSILQILLSNSI
jgi:hypothetical protein